MKPAIEARPDWHSGALDAVALNEGADVEFDVRATARTDHLVGTLTRRDGSRWFVKAFAPGHARYFAIEDSVYRTATAGTVPSLRHSDRLARVIVTEYCPGGRLGDLDARQQVAHLERIPSLFAGIADLPAGSPEPPDRSDFEDLFESIRTRDHAAGLPAASVVLAALTKQSVMPVHGDFHPLNVVLADDGPRVVDFESYGVDAPGLDAVRMSFNPMLYIDFEARLDLARSMMRALRWKGRKPTDRDLAACCVYWAVCCAAYFARVIANDPSVLEHSPEVGRLATEPLALASDLWNRSL